MAYDGELAQRVRALLDGEPVVEKRMFGGLAFLVDGHMAVAVGGRGGLMARVPPEQLEALLAEPGTDEVVMGQGRRMRGWVTIDDEALGDDVALRAWVTRGLDVVRALPPK
ncbi:TfoX/Sxy family protein [Motilibacter aurantiacus]|uniref:TfoX/Sxy family protein n=1 Tax=Motilibacter aurantiacus TaxID=2714955 RepID=UPI00140E74FD|nr:TfoX/Sxy family protein [Motilibacter aurantiacus]NHC46889.1 TfoX/Sxy family protein [Motilibacter aurantiacus]